MMFDDTLQISRPSNGATSTGPVPPVEASAPAIVPDGAFDRQREVDRLNQQLTDHRFACEAIALALAAFHSDHWDDHKLTTQLSSYHRMFQAVAFAEYLKCANVKLARQVFEILVAEAA